jgi:hypothetical protein
MARGVGASSLEIMGQNTKLTTNLLLSAEIRIALMSTSYLTYAFSAACGINRLEIRVAKSESTCKNTPIN